MADNPDLRVLVGNEGDALPSGESAKLIRDNLEKALGAQGQPVKISIQFDQQGVENLRSEIQKYIGSVPVNITSSIGSQSSSKAQSGAQQVNTARKISAEFTKTAKSISDSNITLERFNEYLRTLNPKVFSTMSGDINTIREQLGTGLPSDIKKARAGINNFKASMKQMGYEGGNMLTYLEGKIKTFGVYLLSSTITMGVVNAVKQVVTNVKDLDAAMTDLRIVTGGTKAETQELLKTYNQIAQTLGTTTLAVSESAAEWQRQGYNLNDTNTLIKDSMVLSIVGMLDSAEAAQYLTSVIKGYKVQVDDAIGIVDKLTAVDMKAAVSAGGIAEAIARTANSARQAGVDMDSLIGYIAAVGEVTQRDMSTVGEAFKTMFARYGNVKLGKLVDDESGESLNDFETALHAVGIALRDEQGQFRDFNDVILEVRDSMGRMSSTEKSALATTLGGIRQRENVLVLLENLDKAFGYAEVAANSSGTAMEKFSAYEQSVEAKSQRMAAAFENLSTSLLDSDLVGAFYDIGTGVFNFVASIPDWIKEITALAAGIAALAATVNGFKATQFGSSFLGTFKDLGWPEMTGDKQKNIVPSLSKEAA